MKRWISLLLLPALAAAAPSSSPYAGEEQRSIKALSPAEIAAFLDGKGMGYAKAAELNHYPGPRHVLEHAGELGLSDQQVFQTREIESRMKKQAVSLGKKLVSLEQSLDDAFARGAIEQESLVLKVMEIARLEGEIRFAHLAAHLDMKGLLSEEQIALYDRLRGYGSKHSGHAH